MSKLFNIKKYDVVQIIFIVSLISFLLYYLLYENYKLSQFGRYTLVEYIGTKTRGRQGSVDLFEFSFKGKKYRKEYAPDYNKNRYLAYRYCKFVPSNPNINRILYDLSVPYCINIKMVPDSGWLTIPRNECVEEKPSLKKSRIEID